MTDQEIINYYANLLIMQYAGLPKAYATIQTLVSGLIANQIFTSVSNGFNIDTAVGVQLDLIGKLNGASRQGRNFTGPMTLTDDQYRAYIKIKIIQNTGGSALYDIQKLISVFFPTTLRVFDYTNMQMSYTFGATIGTQELAEFFVESGALPRPMGVQLSSIIYVANVYNIFSFRTYNTQDSNVQGFNSYSDYQTDWPWIQYSDVVIL
jgi:hypothetical protein